MKKLNNCHFNRLNSRFLVAPLAAGFAVAGLSGVLQAQPDPNNAPKGDNPAGRQGGRGGNRPDFRNMTPEQRQQMRQQMQQQMQQRREEGMRRSLTNAGFADQALQDAVINFANAQEDVRDPLQEKTRQLSEAIRGGSTDEQIAVLLAALRADIAAAKIQREADLKELDAKTGYTQKPKLDALLTLMGLTGEEISGMGGPGMGGRGGFGGGFGGRGGQGLQGRQGRQGNREGRANGDGRANRGNRNAAVNQNA